MKRNLLKNNGVQSLLASLVCIVLGLFLGYVVLLIINPVSYTHLDVYKRQVRGRLWELLIMKQRRAILPKPF